MDITYNQVLADEQIENAKAKLVISRQYDYDQLEEQDDNLDTHALENPEEFNKFHGNRNKPEHVIVPDKSAPSTNKDTRVTVINIDGRFRHSILPTLPTTVTKSVGPLTMITSVPGNPGTLSSNFIVRTSRQYINVSEVTVTSIEFPNNFYTFSSSRNNVSFTVEYTSLVTSAVVRKIITIPDGNYVNIVNPTTNNGLQPIPPNATVTYLDQNDVTTLVGAIQEVIDDEGTTDSDFQGLQFQILYSLTQHNIQFTAVQGRVFKLIFPETENNCYGNGIGYNLGFTNKTVSSIHTVTNSFGVKPALLGAPDSVSVIGDVFPDVIQDRYIYLIVNDWNLVEHQTINQTYFTAFAKIPLTSPKTEIYNDSATVNTISKTYKFHQPTNINLISIKLVDSYNQVIDMKDSSISMTLEVTEVTNSAEYQRLLQT